MEFTACCGVGEVEVPAGVSQRCGFEQRVGGQRQLGDAGASDEAEVGRVNVGDFAQVEVAAQARGVDGADVGQVQTGFGHGVRVEAEHDVASAREGEGFQVGTRATPHRSVAVQQGWRRTGDREQATVVDDGQARQVVIRHVELLDGGGAGVVDGQRGCGVVATAHGVVAHLAEHDVAGNTQVLRAVDHHVQQVVFNRAGLRGACACHGLRRDAAVNHVVGAAGGAVGRGTGRDDGQRVEVHRVRRSRRAVGVWQRSQAHVAIDLRAAAHLDGEVADFAVVVEVDEGHEAVATACRRAFDGNRRQDDDRAVDGCAEADRQIFRALVNHEIHAARQVANHLLDVAAVHEHVEGAQAAHCVVGGIHATVVLADAARLSGLNHTCVVECKHHTGGVDIHTGSGVDGAAAGRACGDEAHHLAVGRHGDAGVAKHCRCEDDASDGAEFDGGGRGCQRQVDDRLGANQAQVEQLAARCDVGLGEVGDEDVEWLDGGVAVLVKTNDGASALQLLELGGGEAQGRAFRHNDLVHTSEVGGWVEGNVALAHNDALHVDAGGQGRGVERC